MSSTSKYHQSKQGEKTMVSRQLRVVFMIVFSVMLLLGFSSFVYADSVPKTLSPYFFIENGEEGVDLLPLKATQVQVTLDAVIAKVTVRQTYKNDGTSPINARYIFPGSTHAAVHGMRMKIGEQVVVAKIKERMEATKKYENAKKEGKSASLLTQERPNVFSMHVANIMPGVTVQIQLDYTELLVPTEGVYEFVYPTVVGPRYSTISEKNTAPNHQWIKNPYLKSEQDPIAQFNLNLNLKAGLPIQDLVCPSHKIQITWEDKSSAMVTLDPAEINGGDRDYILRYRLTGKTIHSGLMLFEGQSENFFLLMVQPPQRVTPEALPPREYIFVVDVSGSMHGFPLNTAKRLLKDLITSLRPQDRFNVILFANSAERLSPQSLAADPTHINQAMKLIDQQQGGGGTELYHGLKTALRLPRDENISRSVVVVTDGYIALEKKVFSLVEHHLSDTNFFPFGIGSSVNRYLIEGFARVGQGEPFVITDPSEAGPAVKRFRKYIEAPVLTKVKIHYNDWEVYDQQPKHISDLFAQRPIVVSGKWRNKPAGKIEITGMTPAGEFRQSIELDQLKITYNNGGLPYLWARTRLAHLMDFNPDSEDQETAADVTSLGLTYHLLTPHTAFVAVDETIRNPTGKAKDVKQPSPLPKGVSNLAVGGGHQVPEPKLLLMVTLLGLVALASWLHPKRRKRHSLVNSNGSAITKKNF